MRAQFWVARSARAMTSAGASRANISLTLQRGFFLFFSSCSSSLPPRALAALLFLKIFARQIKFSPVKAIVTENLRCNLYCDWLFLGVQGSDAFLISGPNHFQTNPAIFHIFISTERSPENICTIILLLINAIQLSRSGNCPRNLLERQNACACL